MTHIICFLCTTLGGFLLGLYLKRKTLHKSEFFGELCKYVNALKLNVTGRQVELAKFNAEFATGTSPLFAQSLSGQKFPPLPLQQKKRVEQFFACLDSPTAGQLLQNLEYFGKQFEEDFAAASAEVKKANVYMKVGLLLGAMVGILFL